jgi:hypothetical protein
VSAHAAFNNPRRAPGHEMSDWQRNNKADVVKYSRARRKKNIMKALKLVLSVCHRHISFLSIGDCNGLGGIDIVVHPESVPVDSAQLFIDKPTSEYSSLELKLRSEFVFDVNTFRTNFLTRLRRGRCDFSDWISWSPVKS